MSKQAREALRQQMLLRALLGDARPGVVAGWLRDGARTERGLAAYRASAGALAERALAAAFPTVQQLLGKDSFAALARAFWQRQPPRRGDIGLWGEGLAAFIADAESLAEEPYLADVARLEWAVHLAGRAADAAPALGLEQLAVAEPAELAMRLQPGTALVESRHPIVTIWTAHRSQDAERFVPVRAALAANRAESALVVRQGWPVVVMAIEPGPARFIAALLAGRSLGAALDAAPKGLDFEAWLIAALRDRRIAAVERLARKERT